MRRNLLAFVFLYLTYCNLINADEDETEIARRPCPQIMCHRDSVLVRDPYGRRCPYCVRRHVITTTMSITITPSSCVVITCAPGTIYTIDPTGQINDGCPYCKECPLSTTPDPITHPDVSGCPPITCGPYTEYIENPEGCPYCLDLTTQKICTPRVCPPDYKTVRDPVTGCPYCVEDLETTPCPTPVCLPPAVVVQDPYGGCAYCKDVNKSK